MADTVETRWESHNEAGRRFFMQGDYAQAEQSFIAAIREATLLGADNPRLALSLASLGQLKYRQKDLAQAEALFRRSLSIRERLANGDQAGLVQTINSLAALHYARGEIAQAEPLFARALEVCEQHLGENHPEAAATLNNLARLYFRKNDFAAAAPLLLRLLAIKERTLGLQHPEVAAIVASLAKVRAAEGDLESAEQLARRALAVREATCPPDDIALAPSLEALAEILALRGRPDEERLLRARAGAIRSRAPRGAAPAGIAAQPSVELQRRSANVARVESNTGAPRRTSTSVGVPAGAAGGASAQPAPRTSRPVPARPDERTGSAPASASPAPPAPTAVGNAAPTDATAPRREPTTKSTTLPWIEAPTSPALKRPPVRHDPLPAPLAASAPLPVPGPLAPSGATISRPLPDELMRFAPAPPPAPAVDVSTSIAPSPTDFEKPQRFTTREGTSGPREHTSGARSRSSAPDPGEVADASDETVEWDFRRRRPWRAILIAAGIVVTLGVSAWLIYGPSSSDADTAAAAGSVAAPPASASDQGSAASPAPPVEGHSVEGSAPAPQATDQGTGTPEATNSAARPESKSHDEGDVAPASTPHRESAATPQSATRESERRADPAAAVHTKLPHISVDKVVNQIGQNAKQRVDSLGRTINVKPPTFGKPQP